MILGLSIFDTQANVDCWFTKQSYIVYGYNLVKVILMGTHFVKQEMLVSPLELAAALDYHLGISSPNLLCTEYSVTNQFFSELFQGSKCHCVYCRQNLSVLLEQCGDKKTCIFFARGDVMGQAFPKSIKKPSFL